MTWAKGAFNENRPWGKKGIPIQGDNIEVSRDRWEATQACRQNRATPEQRMLIEETDQQIQALLADMED